MIFNDKLSTVNYLGKILVFSTWKSEEIVLHSSMVQKTTENLANHDWIW